MRLSFVFIILSLLTCFSCRTAQLNPAKPSDAVGWINENPNNLVGKFLLKQGEATDNGTLQVRLVRVVAPHWLAEPGSYASTAKGQFQFVKVSDGKVLCNIEAPLGNTLFGSAGFCENQLDDFNVRAIYVKAVNTQDNWVYFHLVK